MRMGFGVPSMICDSFVDQVREVVFRNFWEEGDWLEESDFSCFVSQFVPYMSFVGWDISERYCKCQLLNL